MYSVAGKLLVQLITFLIRKFERSILKNEAEIQYLYVKTVVVGIVFLLVLMLIGSCITTAPNMEDLDISSSIYFWFVTWSTIGYGDITFQREKHLQSPHLMLVAVFNLLFGLGMYVAIIEAFSSAMVKKNCLKDEPLIIDSDGNVNNEDGEKKLQLSHNQQSRLQDVLRRYREIKDSQSTLPPLPQPVDDVSGGLTEGITNKVFEGEEFHRRNSEEVSNIVRPFSGLSAYSDQEEKVENTTSGL